METTAAQNQNLVNPVDREPSPIPVKPKISEIGQYYLTIGNMPDVDYQTLNNSRLIRIIHGVKTLFTEGDHGGKKVHDHKRRKGIVVENDVIRLCVAYTFNYKDGTLKVNFWPSYAQDSALIIDEQHQTREMTNQERSASIDLFIQQCATEITTFLDDTYTQALENGTLPNYYVPHQA